jgi:hypothetical protein
MAGRGGARPGAGRPKGRKSSATLKKEAARERAALKNLMPVEYLLSILRDKTQPQNVRMEAAKWAAPYISPRLASVEVVKSLRAMSLEELRWFIADAELATKGWQPRLIAGGRRR